jgi:hypothetical protein
MKLESVVPFGRSLEEYRLMFGLSERDLAGRIAGIADGPASFNAQMQVLEGHVVSVDPLYVFGADAIAERFHAVVDEVIGQVANTPEDWVWRYHRSPEHLRANRFAALERFVEDYETGRAKGRYLVGALPALPLPDDAFDLALCSHFLFLYSSQYSYAFHLHSLEEMLRVAPEVRVFPLVSLEGRRSAHLDPLLQELARRGVQASIEAVDYELQRGGNQMLRLQRPAPGTRH